MNTTIFIITTFLLQFVISALWFGLVFGKKWSQIHGFDLLSLEEQKAIEAQMAPYYGLQALLTFIFTFIYQYTYVLTSSVVTPITLSVGIFVFLAVIVIESVIWGSTSQKYWLTQISIMLGDKVIRLLILTIGALILL